MLYKFPGPFELQDGKYDYIIVDEDDVEITKKEGWFLTMPEARKAADAVKSAVKPTVKSAVKPL